MSKVQLSRTDVNYSSVGVLIGAVSNVIFSMIFLQFWGGTGAALDALLANFLTPSFMARGEHRFFGAPVRYGKLALSYLMSTPIFAAMLWVNQNRNGGWIGFLLRLSLIMIFAGLLTGF